ncbi:MAG TPA: cupin domain-containing protein [Spirochaetes bacterium]|nr:cupin domain-containing protein [Spirochaetota bacterium]
MKTRLNSKDYEDFLNDLDGYYQKPSGDEKQILIGERLKKIREIQGMTLERLAQKAGVDGDLLRDIEDCKAFPDLGTIIRLSRALSIATGVLIDDSAGYSYSIVRRDDRKNIARVPTGKKEKPTYTYQSLSMGVQKRHMDAFIVTLEPCDETEELSSHEGEEFITVMEGEVAILLGNKKEVLGEGDSVYYLSSIPHALYSNTGGQAVIMAVLYTGS